MPIFLLRRPCSRLRAGNPPGETRSLLLRKRQILSRGFCCRLAFIVIPAATIGDATPSGWREAIP